MKSRPIAAVPVKKSHDQGRDIGYFHPSNIIEYQGMKYMFVRTSGGGVQQPATCLMRSANPVDPESWQIFDGKKFKGSLFDPYRDTESEAPVCAQISRLNGMIFNVLRHRPTGTFIAVMVVIEPKMKSLRLATSTSIDLMEWSVPRLVEGITFEWQKGCSDTVYHYPSLADPDAPGRNFDTTDDDAFLFMTAIHRDKCKMTMNRDLIMRPVHLNFHLMKKKSYQNSGQA